MYCLPQSMEPFLALCIYTAYLIHCLPACLRLSYTSQCKAFFPLDISNGMHSQNHSDR